MKIAVVLLTAAFGSTYAISLVTTTSRSAHRQPKPQMSANHPEGDRTTLMAGRDDVRRVGVSGLQPMQQQRQQYVAVPPRGHYDAPPPSFVQKARGPFMGLTLIVSAAVLAWQSNRIYKERQAGLLKDFGATMVFHLGNEKEMASAIREFRAQLGPGKYRGDMFQSYLLAMATDVPTSIKAITSTKTVMSLMKVPDIIAAQVLEKAAAQLQKQPSVLGKLTFVAERTMPMAASMAKLRTRFPNWSLDTVTALQRAMLENLYRDLCKQFPPGSIGDRDTLQVMKVSPPIRGFLRA